MLNTISVLFSAATWYTVDMQNSLLSPSDILIELIACGEDEDGDYRTLSSEILIGQVPVPEAQQAVSRCWAKALAGKTMMVGAVDPVPFSVLRDAPVEPVLLHTLLDWMREQGLPDLTERFSVSPLGCRAVPFHQDLQAFGDSLFCVVWLSAESRLELVFPALETRVPLQLGTVVVFDSGQPHGVVRQGEYLYVADAYPDLPVQTFISLDFGATLPGVAARMGIHSFDTPHGWPGKVAGEAGPAVEPSTDCLTDFR